jgi:hypothetical protein
MEIDICPRWILARLRVPSQSQHHVAVLVSTLLSLALLPLALFIPHFCLMQKVLGIPCPGCGVCHSIMAILRLKPALAWEANPAGVGVASVFCFQLTEHAGYPAWAIIVSICLFPLGLLALLAGCKPDDLWTLRVHMERLDCTCRK